MNTIPLLGIAIPAFKREDLLGRLLESIRADCPIVVSDNGGNLSHDFKERHSSVRFLVGPEVPVLENWNRAASALSTQWIIMPGDDDLYFQDSFEIIEKALRKCVEADIVFFGHHIIDEFDRIKTTWQPLSSQITAPCGFDEVRRGTPARPPGIAFKAALFHRLGGFSEEFKITAGDNDFYQRATLIGNVAFVDQVVTGYRVWESGSTKQTIATQDWLREIDQWCCRVRRFAAEQSAGSHYPRSLQDEIYLANLRSGIGVLKERGGYWAAWRHFFSSRYPFRASLLAQLKLFAHLLLPLQR